MMVRARQGWIIRHLYFCRINLFCQLQGGQILPLFPQYVWWVPIMVQKWKSLCVVTSLKLVMLSSSMMEALQVIVCGQNGFPQSPYYFTLRLVSSLHDTQNSETNFGENMKLR
jgi:hypothetical protein